MTTSEPIDATRSTADGVDRFRTADVFGLPFIACGDEPAVARALAGRQPRFRQAGDPLPLVVTPNVDIMVQLQSDEATDVRDVFARSEYVLPDGWPIVKVSRRLPTSLEGRIAGSTVFSQWWPQIVTDGRRVAALVSQAAVAEGLQREHPNAVCVVPPMISTSAEDIGAAADDFVKEAVQAEAEFVIFGIGHPKDTLLATAMLDRWPSDLPEPLCLCLGASAEMHLGLRKRAPEWAQKIGMEWFVRFAQEPRRMFYRYFVRDVAFIPMAIREIRARR